jgi:DNA-binding CsgD family transcriptional regulator
LAPDAFVDRLPELLELDRMVAGLEAGRGGVCWINGEPGIGKSTLVDLLADRTTDRGCQVYRGASDALLEAFPLRVVADALGVSSRSADPGRAQVAALLRGERSGSEVLDPVLAASERLLDLVDRQCAIGPTVLALEDLHWADEPSLLLFSRLARATGQLPLLLVGTARPLPRRDTVDRLRELVIGRGGVLIALGPLSPGGVAELAGRIAGGAPGPRLRAVLERAGGNPLYVRELVDALVRDHVLTVNGGASEFDGDVPATPLSLSAAIADRLGFLSPSARAALRTAALLGVEFDVADLAVVTGRPVTQVGEVLTEAVESGVLGQSGRRLRFRHELLHRSLVEQMPAALLDALHNEIARELAAAGSPLGVVARHLLLVPERVEDWALSWLAAVPETVLYALPQVWGELLDRAVTAVAPSDPRYQPLATRSAQVLFWLGRDEQASRIAGRVARDTGDAPLAARMRVLLIRSAGRLRRIDEAVNVALCSPGDEGLPLLWRARLGAWSAVALFDAGQVEQAAATALEALDAALESGDELAMGSARHAASICCGPADRPGHMKAALEVLSVGDPEAMDLKMLVMANAVTQFEDLGWIEEAAAMSAEALRLADRIGTVRIARIQGTAAGLCYRTGRWDEALAHLSALDPGLAAADRVDQVHALGVVIALRRGEVESADAHIRAVGVTSPSAPGFYPFAEPLAMRAEFDGDLERAAALMAMRLEGPRIDGHRDDLPYAVRLALETGDRALAAVATERAEAEAVELGSRGRVLAHAFCRALMHGDTAGLLAVADDYRRCGWVPYSGSAFEEAAVSLAAAGETVQARAALTEAARVYAELGAARDLRRADARLRPHGVRRGSRSTHRRAAHGWEALTPGEQRIARLVAQGQSNPDIAKELFLSRRTVQAHVSSILAKLQVRSRIGVALEASRAPAAG